MEDVVLVTPAVVVKPIDDEVEKARTTRPDDVLPPKRSVVSIADGMVIFILTYTTIVVEWVARVVLVWSTSAIRFHERRPPEKNEGQHRVIAGSQQWGEEREQHQSPHPSHAGTPKRPAWDAALETPEDLAPGQCVIPLKTLVTGRLWGLVGISQCALAGGWSPQG